MDFIMVVHVHVFVHKVGDSPTWPNPVYVDPEYDQSTKSQLPVVELVLIIILFLKSLLPP